MSESTSSLPEVARGLFPVLDGNAEWGEANGRLHDAVIDALHENNLFGIWVPRELGGLELDPIASLQTIEALSHADPSAGWVHMAAGLAIGTAGAYLGSNAVDVLFGSETMPVIAGQGTRPGAAVPVDGGLRITGSWSFASGLLHANYIHTLTLVQATGEPRICVLPVEQAELHDNWDVMGLRATGSIDYTIDGAIVPDGFSHFARTEEPLRGGSLYRSGLVVFALMGHSGWALGCARRLLDELNAGVQTHAGRPGSHAQSDSFHDHYARAEMKLRAARALVFETWGDVQDTLYDRGSPLSFEQNTLMRLALANATWSVQEVASFVYFAGGTTSLRTGTIQRFFRDVHAGTQHISSGPRVIQNTGRALAGLADGQRWTSHELTDR